MSEGSLFFEGKGAVQSALKKIAGKLRGLGVDYAVVGGMALFSHGYRRFTEDVDLLVTREGLKEIHRRLRGLGYRPPFAGSKHLRDSENNVKVEFLVTGDYPGDGKQKPVSFPDPASCATERDGIRYLNLETLIELKLASGMTNTERLRDLSDVVELIKALSLPLGLAEKLNEFVQEKYRELWRAANPPTKRYLTIWRNKFLTLEATSLGEMADTLQAAVEHLRQMQADGVTLDPDGGVGDDYAHLVTTDPDVARKYDMHDESDFWDEGDEPADE